MIGKIFCAVQNIHSADLYGIHLIGRIRGGGVDGGLLRGVGFLLRPFLQTFSGHFDSQSVGGFDFPARIQRKPRPGMQDLPAGQHPPVFGRIILQHTDRLRSDHIERGRFTEEHRRGHRFHFVKGRPVGGVRR